MRQKKAKRQLHTEEIMGTRGGWVDIAQTGRGEGASYRVTRNVVFMRKSRSSLACTECVRSTLVGIFATLDEARAVAAEQASRC